MAGYIARNHPDLKGFTRRNLYRMRQFYETYADNLKVSALLTQLPWTHNLSIISRCQNMGEREFYLQMAIKEKWSSRELDRQLNASLFERTLPGSTKEFVSPPLTQIHPSAPEVFRDCYMMEFLNLPEPYEESDLQLGLVRNLKSFLLELGREFCFVGEHYRLQVGMKDFYLDLLFFHRGLRCLVVFELKVEDFQPAHLGQLNFYLEALDREVKLPEENPSVGILLCKSRDQDVVEYAMNRTLSPALVAEYQTQLPEKKLLEERLGLID